MKKYKVTEGLTGKIISYKKGNLTVEFGEWEGNSDYAEYLRYTEWVEAGNNPEDFWDRSDDLNETAVSEDSEPKEEE